jgi:hypothetical protein
MPIIEKTFWLIAIAITFANAYLLWSRSKVEVERHPELRAGYGRLLRGYLIFLNLPWLVMGLGILVGGAETVFDYYLILDQETSSSLRFTRSFSAYGY